MLFSDHIKLIEGNIFNSKAHTIVNTVNTVGVMGKGLALEFRIRYPEMFKQYLNLCKENKLKIGDLWIYKTKKKWILNFPTKIDWRDDSKIEYLEIGLRNFINIYKQKKIKSIAFPILGSNLGNIPPEISLKIMYNYLSECDIPIEIYKYNPNSSDDIFDDIKNNLLKLSGNDYKFIFHLNENNANKIKQILNDESIKNTYEFINRSNLSANSLIHLFDYIFDRIKNRNVEKMLQDFRENFPTDLKEEQLKKLKYCIHFNKINNKTLTLFFYLFKELYGTT